MPMTPWQITDGDGAYTLHWSKGFIRVAPSHLPYSLILDAVLEFMDRFAEGNIPRFCQNPSDLMAYCMNEARRQH
jgi:hypothetical protein